MRGKRGQLHVDAIRQRNIPAYAGKTARGGSCCRVTGEHPRVCGENCADLPVPYEHHGTSPRMRGKLLGVDSPPVTRRNIPAYAGKTKHDGSSRWVDAEHPRVCGENESPPPPPRAPEGTSPRMRGKLEFANINLNMRRNIPAYAGKTGVSDATAVLQQEHPRVCGENFNR